MGTWHRDEAVERKPLYDHAVRLAPNQWQTYGVEGATNPNLGIDAGGHIFFVKDIVDQILANEAFTGYAVQRVAMVTVLNPRIITFGEMVTDTEVTEIKKTRAFDLGKHYDIFASFPTKEQAVLFKLTFSGLERVKFG